MNVYHCGQFIDAENYMYKMDEEYSLAEKLESTSLIMSNNVMKCSKKEARYLLVKNLCVASIYLKLNLNRPHTPSIYGITPVEELEDIRIWVDKVHVNTFILLCPKTWAAC